MAPEKQNRNPELQSIISPLEERPSESRDTSMLASTLQATIDNLEEAAKKAKGEKAKELNKKLKDAQFLKNRLVKAGKSIIDAENKIREREKKGAHQLTDRGIEAQGKVIEKAQLEINNINKKLIVLLKSFDETIDLKSDIEERKKLITLLSGSKNKGLPKDKQNLDFNILSIEELRALEAGINTKEGLAKTIEAGIGFLPFSERVIDLASATVEQLNKVAAKIEANKKTFEKFKVIGVFASLAEKSLFVYFYKYLENKAKPAIETLVKVFNDIKKKAEEYRLAQEKVLAETKKITEIEARIAKKQGQHFEMPSFETMSSLMRERNDSILKSDFLEIFAKLLNNPVAEIKKYLASFDEAIEGQKTSLVGLTMNESVMISQEKLLDESDALKPLITEYNVECRLVEDLADVGGHDPSKMKMLEGKIKEKQTFLSFLNINILTSLIAGLKFDESLLGKAYNSMVALASTPNDKRTLFAEFEAMKGVLKEKIAAFNEQIADINFAMETAKDEEKFKAELASGGEFSEGSKKFAGKKSAFLDKKLKTLDENFAAAATLYNESGGNSEAVKAMAAMDSEKKAILFEKKVLDGKFSLEEAMNLYAEFSMNKRNQSFADSVRFYLETLGPKEVQDSIFSKVDNGVVAFENDLGLFFNESVVNSLSKDGLNYGYLEKVAKPKAGEMMSQLESNGFFKADIESAQDSVSALMSDLQAKGLASSSLFRSLQKASDLYKKLLDRYSVGQGCPAFRLLSFVANEAKPKSDIIDPRTWVSALETFRDINAPIIIGATTLAVVCAAPVALLGVGGVAGTVLASVLAGAGATVGQELMKPVVGLKSDWSAGNLAQSFAFNTTLSLGFIGAGRLVGASLSKAATAGKLSGNIGKAVIRIANMGGTAAETGGMTIGKYFASHLLERPVFEAGQELIEEAGQQVNPWLGGLLSLVNSMDGINVNVKVEPEIVKLLSSSEVTYVSATDTRAVFEYNSNTDLESQLRGLTQRWGGTVTNVDGVVKYSFNATPSSTTEITYEFRPSTEGFSARNFLSTEAGLVLQVDFGVVTDQTGEYVYTGKSSKALKNRLEANGFVVQTAGDVVVAQKGDLQLTFKPKRLVSGTNIGTMENTRLQTLEDVDPVRLEEIRAGSTIGSEVVSLLTTDVGTLWAKMKTSLGGDTRVRTPEALTKMDAKIAESIKGELSRRGLSENLLSGLSPVEQLQVLNSVTEIEKEAGLAGDNEQFGDAVERAKPGEDVFVSEEVGGKFLSPERYMELLNDPDGFGVYKIGVLLVNSPVIPPFTVDQILKISEESPDLAAFVINKVAQTMPGKFSFDKIVELDGTDSNLAAAALAGLLKTPEGLAIREAYYNDIYSRFEGGKEEFTNTARDLFTKFSSEAFEKMQNALKGLKKPSLSLPVLALLTGCDGNGGVGGWLGEVGGKLVGLVGAEALSATGNVIVGALSTTGGAIYLTLLTIGLFKNPKGFGLLKSPALGFVTIVTGTWNLVIKGGRGAMGTRTSAADAAKANQDTRAILGIATPPVVGAPRISDLLDFGAGAPPGGGPSANTDLAAKAGERIGRNWKNPEFRAARSNFNILKTAIVDIENNIATKYIHPELLKNTTLLPTLFRLMGEASGLAGNLNAIIAAPVAPGAAPLPPGTPSPREIAANLLVDKMIEINDVLEKKINVPKKGSPTETEEKTVLDLLSNPLKMSDSPTLKEKLWNKDTRLKLIIAAALVAVGGTLALWPEKEKPVAPTAPSTAADVADTENKTAKAKDQIGTTESRKEALEGGIPDRVDDPVKVLRNDVSGCVDQYPTKIPAPIKVIAEKFVAGDDTDKALLEKLHISSVLSSLEDGRPLNKNAPKWMSADMYLQGRFLQDCREICVKKHGVQFSGVFYKKFDEMKYAMKGANENPEFTKLQTDEERVEYYKKLVNETADLLIAALR